MPRYAFLGPAGTFSEEALLTLGIDDLEPVACASIGEVFEAVERGSGRRRHRPDRELGRGLGARDARRARVRHVARDPEPSSCSTSTTRSSRRPGADLARRRHRSSSHPQATRPVPPLARSATCPAAPSSAANSTAEAVQRAVADPPSPPSARGSPPSSTAARSVEPRHRGLRGQPDALRRHRPRARRAHRRRQDLARAVHEGATSPARC